MFNSPRLNQLAAYLNDTQRACDLVHALVAQFNNTPLDSFSSNPVNKLIVEHQTLRRHWARESDVLHPKSQQKHLIEKNAVLTTQIKLLTARLDETITKLDKLLDEKPSQSLLRDLSEDANHTGMLIADIQQSFGGSPEVRNFDHIFNPKIPAASKVDVNGLSQEVKELSRKIETMQSTVDEMRKLLWRCVGDEVERGVNRFTAESHESLDLDDKHATVPDETPIPAPQPSAKSDRSGVISPFASSLGTRLRNPFRKPGRRNSAPLPPSPTLEQLTFLSDVRGQATLVEPGQLQHLSIRPTITVIRPIHIRGSATPQAGNTAYENVFESPIKETQKSASHAQPEIPPWPKRSDSRRRPPPIRTSIEKSNVYNPPRRPPQAPAANYNTRRPSFRGSLATIPSVDVLRSGYLQRAQSEGALTEVSLTPSKPTLRSGLSPTKLNERPATGPLATPPVMLLPTIFNPNDPFCTNGSNSPRQAWTYSPSPSLSSLSLKTAIIDLIGFIGWPSNQVSAVRNRIKSCIVSLAKTGTPDTKVADILQSLIHAQERNHGYYCPIARLTKEKIVFSEHATGWCKWCTGRPHREKDFCANMRMAGVTGRESKWEFVFEARVRMVEGGLSMDVSSEVLSSALDGSKTL